MEKKNPLSRDIAIVIIGYIHYHTGFKVASYMKVSLENKFFDELCLRINEPFGMPGYLQVVLTGVIKGETFHCSMCVALTIREGHIQHEAERLIYELTHGVINNMGIH